MPVQFTILEPYSGERQIQVRFTYAGVTHERSVNVCFDDEGEYDHEATLERVMDIASGVKHKIDAGAINNPQTE